MNTHTFVALLLGLCIAANGFAADAPSTKNPSKDEIELLRRVLQEQRANPDKIIRTPSATNPPPAAAAAPKPQTAPPPAATVPPPAVKSETGSPASVPAPKVEATKPVIVAAPAKTQAPSSATPTNFPTWTELEDAYLNRKISSKRFEEALKLLDRHKQITNERQDAVNRMLLEKGIEPPAPPPASPAEQKKISDVEGKVDELMRLKAQREQSPAGAVAPTAPLTKRDRLNELLRQMVDGKITDAEYKEKRDKIIAEPD